MDYHPHTIAQVPNHTNNTHNSQDRKDFATKKIQHLLEWFLMMILAKGEMILGDSPDQ